MKLERKHFSAEDAHRFHEKVGCIYCTILCFLFGFITNIEGVMHYLRARYAMMMQNEG